MKTSLKKKGKRGNVLQYTFNLYPIILIMFISQKPCLGPYFYWQKFYLAEKKNRLRDSEITSESDEYNIEMKK